MKWVWGFLILFAVVLGSLFVWWGFADQGVLLKRFEARHQGSSGQKEAPLIPLPFLMPTEREPEGKVLAVFGEAPDFSLSERKGNSFSKKDLAGKPWIADFIFTSCAGQCPLMSLQMKKLQELFSQPTGFRFVSFTVDPDRDTPETLSTYADRYQAEKDRWFFLTGPKGEMNRILSGFFLSPVDQPAMHSIRFILVDQEGKIRGYYDSSDSDSMNQLIHDARILALSQ